MSGAAEELPVLVERLGDGVARVTLNRPAARNAVNGALALELGAVVRDLEADPAARTVVLRGAGKGFCAGADLSAVAAGDEAALWTSEGGFAGFVAPPRAKLWLAAVKGFALAGGLEIVLACDLVVAAADALFGLPEVKRGLIAGAGGLVRLPRAIPRAVAIEMIATGEAIRGERAGALVVRPKRMVHPFGPVGPPAWRRCTESHQAEDESSIWFGALGLVNRVVPADDVDVQALEMARLVADNAPVAVRESLAIARDAHEGNGADLLRRSEKALSRLRQGEDVREGARAFLEKRLPRGNAC